MLYKEGSLSGICVVSTAGSLAVRGYVLLHVLLARGGPLDSQHQLSTLGRTKGRPSYRFFNLLS